MEKQMVITPDMNIRDVVGSYPDTVLVFLRHGLGCVGCAAAHFESIREGAIAHGIDVDLLTKDLNDTIAQAQPN